MELKKIKDICNISGGYAFKSSDFTDNGVAIIRIGDIDNNKVSISDSTVYINESISKYEKFIVKKGDILIALSGATTGKFGMYNYEDVSLLNQRVAKLEAKDKVINKYLFYYMYKLREGIYNKALGCAQPNISPSEIGELSIYVPDITVQERIVKVLDKAQELIDKRKAQIEALDELVKSRFIDMFGDVVSNSKKWDVVKLGEVSNVGSSKRVFVSELVDEGIPFYRGTEVAALSLGEEIVPTLFITKEHYQELKDSTGVPEVGDLLMPSICSDGKIWCVDTDEPFYFKDGRVLWINLKKNLINSVFLKSMLCEKFNRDYNKIASGTTFAELKIFALKDLDIVVPPLELQNEFADFVKQVDKLKSQMQESLKELEDNFNSLMQKAFKGELFN